MKSERALERHWFFHILQRFSLPFVIVVNKDIAYTKVFDNQWFSAEFVDIGDETKPTLISDIHFNTKNQETEPIDWKQIEQREDTFRFPVPRADKNEDALSLPARLRGKYMICDYELDSDIDHTFEIPQITTTYRNSLI